MRGSQSGATAGLLSSATATRHPLSNRRSEPTTAPPCPPSPAMASSRRVFGLLSDPIEALDGRGQIDATGEAIDLTINSSFGTVIGFNGERRRQS